MMAWLRLDDSFSTHPKILALTDAEFRVWIRLLCHCARHRRSVVDAATRRELRGLGPRRIARFVSLGLLDELAPGAYAVHEWTQFQPKDPTAAARKARWRGRVTSVANGRSDTASARHPAL
jgi:hypothetical protein